MDYDIVVDIEVEDENRDRSENVDGVCLCNPQDH